jgi:5-methylcytosine-specific restriction enzyme subunit McrC
MFLGEVADITHKGLKRSYIRSEVSLQAVKGKMIMSKQALRLPHQHHINHLEYDLYSYDRPENKLLAHCLRLVSRWAADPEIRKKAQRLKSVFADIPESSGLKGDFRAWSTKRDMAYYQPAKKWVEYIIRYCSPYALAGKFEGPSLLFPTDKLFESFIARNLPSQLAEAFFLKGQVGNKYLLHSEHYNKPFYKMKPDFVIYDSDNKPLLILDAKWKIIHQNAFVASDSDPNKMSENDLRQLYVYGHKYLDGEGDVVLIYPKHDQFTHAMPMFDFSDGKKKLRLWVLPYDLEENKLILPRRDHSNIIEKFIRYFN